MLSTPAIEAQYSRFSCPNQACAHFNQAGQGNIGPRSWTGKHKAIERLVCSGCGREFFERAGTLMTRSKFIFLSFCF